jgi:hypothetical protein
MEYEEESEDEDVFAFFPPSTADAAKEGELSAPVGGPALNVAPVTSVGPAGPSQAYYYPAAHANNPFAYAVSSGPSAIDYSREPPSTSDTQDLPPPSTMGSSMEGGAFAYEPPANTTYPSHYPYPVGPPPVSPPSSDLDSQPSTGYGHAHGSDAFKLEKIRSSSEQGVRPGVGEQPTRKTSVINEEGEGEGESTKISGEQRTKDGEEKVTLRAKDQDMDTKALSREVDLGVVDSQKENDQTASPNLERGLGERTAERKDSRGRKKSRNGERSARKSAGGLASGAIQRGGDAPNSEGEPTGLRKRKNVNAGPYLNYPHLNEKQPGGRSGRGRCRLVILMIFSHGLIQRQHVQQLRG